MKAHKRSVDINDLLEVPAKLCRADVLIHILIDAAHTSRLVNPQQTLVFINNIKRAVELLPAHKGDSAWTKADENPKGWKWICNECFKIAYAPPSEDGTCAYKFCPNCGCVMNKQTD